MSMKISVLVNNYNYASYVVDAVRSALEQTRPPDEVIVVDDGSSDESVPRLRAAFGSDARVRVIEKCNGGQLSAFNVGVAQAQGDLLFFLDADDLYEEEYLARAEAFFRAHPNCDFLTCARRETGASADVLLPHGDRDLSFGTTVVATLIGGANIGGPTTTLSMRRWVTDFFMPLPMETMWRVRADDCLVYGASAVGARKWYLAQPSVRYRVHEANRYHRRKLLESDHHRYRLAKQALLAWLRSHLGYDEDALLNAVKAEYDSAGRPRTDEEHRLYCKTIMNSRKPMKWKLSRLLHLYGRRIRQRPRQLARAPGDGGIAIKAREVVSGR